MAVLGHSKSREVGNIMGSILGYTEAGGCANDLLYIIVAPRRVIQPDFTQRWVPLWAVHSCDQREDALALLSLFAFSLSLYCLTRCVILSEHRTVLGQWPDLFIILLSSCLLLQKHAENNFCTEVGNIEIMWYNSLYLKISSI